MLLLRWMHLRKLVPLMDLEGGGVERATCSATRTDKQQAAPTSSRLAPTSNKLAPTSDTIAPTRNIVATDKWQARTDKRQACTAHDTIAPDKRHDCTCWWTERQISRRDSGRTRTRYTASPSLRRSASTSPTIASPLRSRRIRTSRRCSSTRTRSGSRASRSV